MANRGWFNHSREHSLAARGVSTKDGSKRGLIRGGNRRNMTTVCRHPDLKGGMSEGHKPGEYEQKQLKKGIEIEMEHTNNPEIAMQIAMDHLEEHPDYYRYLPKMEKKLEKKEERRRKREQKRKDKLSGKKR